MMFSLKPSESSLFRNREFRLLWIAQVISSLGDWALRIAIPVLVYQATGSKAALALVSVASALPVMLLGLFAGVFVDRWNRRTTMIVSDLGRAAAVLALLAVHGRGDIWLFYLVSIISGTFSIFFYPARTALLAGLLPRERLLGANAISSTSSQVVTLLGPALGGIALGLLHPHGVFVLDALTFLASAAFVVRVANPHLPPGAKAARGVRGIWAGAMTGLGYLNNHATLRGLIGLLIVAILGSGIMNALEYAFARDLWHASPSQFGTVLAVFGLGTLVGGALMAGPLQGQPPLRLLPFGFGLLALTGLGWAVAPNLWWGGVALFGLGLGNILASLPIMTLFQTLVPLELMGRTNATLSAIGCTVSVVSGALAATLVSAGVALRPLFVSVACVFVLCAVLAARSIREETGTGEPNSPGNEPEKIPAALPVKP